MRWERTVTVIGCHVGGEDNHVIVGGVLPPPGATMFEKKRYLETQADELRRWLLLEARCHDGKVERVRFTNVPCFVTHLGAKLDVEGLGAIPVDVAYGGAFFAI